MRIEASYITNIGRFRYRNEDAILTVSRVFSETSMDHPMYEIVDVSGTVPFAVADGMGGHPCGERASGLVLEFLRGVEPRSEEEVRGLLLRAKGILDSYVEESPECFGMGTAVAGMFVSESRAFVFNVGDCRVYRRRETLERLTRDHTVVQELFERGLIDEEGMRSHPERNFLTSAIIGGYPERPDVFTREITVAKGDVFLICSDGLWDEVSKSFMDECLRGGVREGGVRLFEEAYRGGGDNISFIILRVL